MDKSKEGETSPSAAAGDSGYYKRGSSELATEDAVTLAKIQHVSTKLFRVVCGTICSFYFASFVLEMRNGGTSCGCIFVEPLLNDILK